MDSVQKHLIMGTAGHVDHGKTALIKALTAIECDTHPEEKKRGITINLGFANCSFPSGLTLSIIDVPGHKDFIHTMVCGACGIDFVLMVIGADSGIMPQTREHLQIMEMLNVKKGIVALTKIDLVDPDIVELAHEEITEFVEGTFLEDAPIVAVSAVTGEGISDLFSVIENYTSVIEQRCTGDIFRMFIDRIFTVKGFGTVVTGSVLSGTLRSGDFAYVLPTEEKLKVRRLERHGKEVTEIFAGDRASINLQGLDREDFVRGMLITDRVLKSTTLVDASVTLFPNAPEIHIWSEAIFLLGTYEAKVRIHLLNANSAKGADTVLVQIHLPKPCTICAGDRFIIRNTSKDISLGGGEILDPNPLHHRRRPSRLIHELERVSEGKLKELIAITVRKTRHVLHHQQIAESLNISPQDIAATINWGYPDDIVVVQCGESMFVVSEDTLCSYKNTICKNIEAFHKRYPLEEKGRTVKDLIGALDLQSLKNVDDFIRTVLDTLVAENRLKQIEKTWVLAHHTVVISDELRNSMKSVDAFLKSFGTRVPLLSELEEFAKKNNIQQKMMNQILQYLVSQKNVYRVEGDYLHADIVDPIRTRLLRMLVERPNGITVAEFRDLISDNRKICLRLFALFDSEGITERIGDCRLITGKGKELIGKV